MPRPCAARIGDQPQLRSCRFFAASTICTAYFNPASSVMSNSATTLVIIISRYALPFVHLAEPTA